MKRIKLPPDYIEFLSSQPETGMGYQKVNIKLKNGQEYKSLTVFNSTYLEVHDALEFDINDIKQVSISNAIK